MSVNRIKIKRAALNDDFITIPLTMNFDTIDKSDLINKEFVEIETAKNINPILDYEKTRFSPKINDVLINKINIELNLLNNGSLLTNTMLSDAGFTQDEINFNKNVFSRSFINLSLYDSDRLTAQRLMSFYTIYLKVLPEYLSPNLGSLAGTPVSVNIIPLKFRVKNPIIFLDDYSEGFNLYHFKDEVPLGLPKVLYMRASFNNAKTGVSHSLMTSNVPQSVDSLVRKLHIKYILTRDNTGYYYSIDTTYSDNIIINGDEVIIKLYEIISD